MMRVLFCITDLDVGGAEKAFVEIVTRIHASMPDAPLGNRARPFECRVVVLDAPPVDARDDLARRLERAGVETSFLCARSMLSAPRVVLRLAGEMRAFQPHVVQSFLHHANAASAVAARIAGRPIVVTGVRVAERRKNLHRCIARRIDPLVARHVCVSQSVADFAVREIRVDSNKVCVIANGVDIALFDNASPWERSDSNIAPQRKLIAFVGRLDQQKRVDWLIQRMPRIAARLPEHDLVIVGDGEESARLARLAETLDIRDRIHFLGWRRDVPSILTSAELLVLCSAWEGMPNAILEAMAAGLPIVTTRCEGVDELLVEYAADQIVATEDDEAFIERVTRFGLDPKFARRVGAANRDAVSARSWDSVACAYAKLYARLAAASAIDAS